MSVADFLRDRYHRALGHDRLSAPGAFTTPLAGGLGLEIGGPSALFRTGGALPAYAALRQVDGIQFSDDTWWHGRMDAGRYELGEPGREGRLWIREGSDLGPLDDASYDAVLSSHVAEHFANPLGALREWLRVLRPGGHLVLVLPHRDGTFDHRRPVTPLEHLVEDERRGTGEDDDTHFEEVLRLHDLRRDPPAGGVTGLRERVAGNPTNRMLHHHVFVTASVLAILDHLGLEIRAVEARWPHDIYTLARRPSDGAAVDNGAWLAPDAAWRRSSPFPSDRR
jgi:SAM-dependent methyltransferase